MNKNERNAALSLEAQVANSLYELNATNIVDTCIAALGYTFAQVSSSHIDVLGGTHEENLKLLAQVYYQLRPYSSHCAHNWPITDDEIAEAIRGVID